MIVIDTSVWNLHFRRGCDQSPLIDAKVRDGEVYLHSMVLTELIIGGISGSREIALREDCAFLPASPDTEVVAFIRAHQKGIRGVGLVDVHVVYAALAVGAEALWTADEGMKELFSRFSPPQQ